MNLFARIADQLRNQKKGQEQAYWDTIAKIVATKDARTINTLTDMLGALGLAAGKRPSDVESDLALVAKLVDLCNAQEQLITARKAIRKLLDAGIESQATELETRARTMRNNHRAELWRARVAVDQARAKVYELAAVREALAASGHAESIKIIEQTSTEERPEVVNA